MENEDSNESVSDEEPILIQQSEDINIAPEATTTTNGFINIQKQQNTNDGREEETKPKPRKFKSKQNENGNILSVHHTIQENNKVIRIPFGVSCFSERGNYFLLIDKRGNLFVFDLLRKLQWRFPVVIPKASVMRATLQCVHQYLVGTKQGHLHLLDTEKSRIIRSTRVAQDAITEISFPGQPQVPSQLVLVHCGSAAIIINAETFLATHRLAFDEVKICLKFASYLPHSEQIFTCFTNDAIHVWSGVTLNTLRIVQPIKVRDRKLRLMGEEHIPQFTLTSATEVNELDNLCCADQDYANGLILAYCYPPDGSQICLSTLDNYLLLLNAYTFEMQHIFRLCRFSIKQCAFLPQAKETLILALTTSAQVVLLDCLNTEFKLIIENPHACVLNTNSDGKLLAVMTKSGEAHLWSNYQLYNRLKSQQQCVHLLKTAFKQQKSCKIDATNECLNEDVKKLLKRERLLPILQEYGSYPARYRNLIWCSLLQLPCNRREFQQLLKMGTPTAVQQRMHKLKLKNETLKRALIKIWSCLAHWCKVFAYSEFVPQLIFPFVKLFPKHALVSFELCVTLLTNHFQLCFEFHPLEPSNYVGMCENILQHFDVDLCKFYDQMQIMPTHYAWSLLSNAFSEVFDEEQWLCLWDNIVSSPLYFPIFCTVAYNLLQREVILRLPDRETITQFFHEQNPIDANKVISKACSLMKNCPASLHPQRYMKSFQSIPPHVYPKFLNYPKESVQKYENDVALLQREHRVIDARLRQLELEEYKMMERLENGLKQEEHVKRVKDMEKLYHETLKREEERIACQRKMLLLYQKEIRSKKGGVIATLAQSENRKRALQMEKDLDSLMHNIERERLRNDLKMTLAEDEIRNEDLELLSQRYADNTKVQPLTQKYEENIKRLSNERKLLQNSLKELLARQQQQTSVNVPQLPANLDDIEDKINEIQKEFMCLFKKN